MVSNIYLKFSELAILDKPDKPFSNTYGVACATVLTEFLFLDEIVYTLIEELVEFVKGKGKNGFNNPYQTVKSLQKAARDSCRLDYILYEPLNVAIASSFNVIKVLESEIKTADKAIKNYQGP